MKKLSTSQITHLALLTALTLALSFVESLLPPLFMLPPGFKVGIANVVVMYALFCLNTVSAVALCLVKSAFVFFINGSYGFTLSLLGSLLSVTVMALLILLFKQKLSYAAISVSGAIAHNIAQITIVYIITLSPAVFLYAPVLLIAAFVCGSATGVCVKLAMPIIQKINKKKI